MLIQKTQPLTRSLRLQNGVQFFMDTYAILEPEGASERLRFLDEHGLFTVNRPCSSKKRSRSLAPSGSRMAYVSMKNCTPFWSRRERVSGCVFWMSMAYSR